MCSFYSYECFTIFNELSSILWMALTIIMKQGLEIMLRIMNLDLAQGKYPSTEPNEDSVFKKRQI